MTAHHGAATPGVVVGIVGGVVLVCLGAVAVLWWRGDRWPLRRTAALVGAGLGVVALLVPVPAGEFTAHMVAHMLVGMVVPLLVALARPMALLVRCSPAGWVRRGLVGLLRSRVVSVLVFAPVAALVDVGGLWVLYRTELLAVSAQHGWLHVVVHFHVFAAGVLFSVAVCQVDPVRYRLGVVARGGVLVAASAAHAVLAKTLYLGAPPGTSFAPRDVEVAAMVMYYGGDLVEIALAVVIALQWYRQRGRQWAGQARGMRTTTTST